MPQLIRIASRPCMRCVLVAIRFLVATWRAASRFIRTASRFCMRRFAARTYRKILAAKVYIYFLNPLPTPNQPPTKAVPSPYQGLCILGFRFKTKSEDAEALVAGWYGAGTALV